MTQPDPPSYLPFVSEKALYHQYDYIRKFLQRAGGQVVFEDPLSVLNETTMRGCLSDTVQAIWIVHEKVQSTNSFAGLVISLSLLPQELITPYQEPLGN